MPNRITTIATVIVLLSAAATPSSAVQKVTHHPKPESPLQKRWE